MFWVFLLPSCAGLGLKSAAPRANGSSPVRRLLLVLLLSFACVRPMSRPDLGECASPPDGAYTYGQIDIGTCLAGPNTLRFQGDPSDPILLVTNANPYLSFTGGSLLAIPWNNIDLGDGRNIVSDLDPHALDLSDFAIGLATHDDLGLVALRESEDARTRASYDDVALIDLSDPSQPAFADRGPDAADRIEVMSDPVAMDIDDGTGLAFVGNRTSHTVSVLDLTGDEVSVIQPWPDQALRQSPFLDADGSGSRAELAALSTTDDESLVDDTWTLSWVEGTWRLWVPSGGGLQRLTTTGQGYSEDGMGTELAVEDADGDYAEVTDPAYEGIGEDGALYFVNEGEVLVATADSYLGDWALEDEAALTGPLAAWDATIGGPEVIPYDGNYWMFYDGTDGESWGIGLASSTDALTFLRTGDPVLEPTWDHEAARISDPTVLYDNQIDLWRMYYSAYDGERWTIGHAVSFDLETWTSDETPIFAVDGVDVAAPVVSLQTGLFRMWYACRDGAQWTLGAATSRDGTTWTDQGTVAELDHNPAVGDEPPGPALLGSVADSFSVAGASTGLLHRNMEPGVALKTALYGWQGRVVAGYHLSPLDGGSDAYGGLRIDAVDLDAGLAWLTLVNRDDETTIGVATLGEDGGWKVERGPVLEGGDDLDADGVSTPAVIFRDGQYWMYYAAHADDAVTIALATSVDGRVWEKQGIVLDLVDEAWDGVAVEPGSVEELDDGTLRLWYTGSNGDLLRIGSATSADGLSWTREEQDANHPWALPPGSPGDWDDSGVRHPYVVRTDEGEHLYYSGFDGENWRVGYAFRAVGEDDWTRAQSAVTEEARPVIGAISGLFHPDGAVRPVATYDADGWSVWFAGLDDDVARVGLAQGAAPDQLHEVVLRPTLGDVLQFNTERGDDDADAVPLDGFVDGRTTTGEGLSAVVVDQDRGLLYVASTHTNYIIALDIRDDSAEGAPDANYLDIEAVVTVDTSSGGAGYRTMALDDGLLYALNDSPEAVYVFDTSQIVDDAYANILYDAQVGYLPTPRGVADEAGEDSSSSVAGGSLIPHPDGERMFVSNFNANSLSVYDRSVGLYGEAVAELSGLGENPYALALSPDGKHLVVGLYTGEVDDYAQAESTLAVVDVDPDSPSYLEVLTWIANR